MPKLYWIYCVLFLIACKPKTDEKLKDTAVSNSSSDTHVGANILATFTTGPCFGSCPEYKMMILEKSIRILKDRNCDKQGAYYTLLTKDEQKQLNEWLEALNWDNIPEKYVTNVTDLPSRTLEIPGDDAHRTTWHTKPTNEHLVNISTYLLKKYSQADWLLYPFEGIKSSQISNQLLIQLKPGIEVYDWVLGYGDCEANPAHSQDKEGHTWLVRYNPFLVSPKDMKARLSQDKDISAFEFVSHINLR